MLLRAATKPARLVFKSSFAFPPHYSYQKVVFGSTEASTSADRTMLVARTTEILCIECYLLAVDQLMVKQKDHSVLGGAFSDLHHVTRMNQLRAPDQDIVPLNKTRY